MNNTLSTIDSHSLKLKYKEKDALKKYRNDLRVVEDGELCDTLWNPYEQAKQNLINWDFIIWSEYQFANVPFKKTYKS